jgi:hypothetical protein
MSKTRWNTASINDLAFLIGILGAWIVLVAVYL